MNTWHKGELAVLKVIERALELGYQVSKPIFEQSRYDLVLDNGKQLYRVQVKFTDTTPSASSGAVVVPLTKTTKNSKVKRLYNAEEIDVVIAYIPRINGLCWFPPNVFEGKTCISVRFEPTKNGQKANLYWFDDYKW